MGRIAYASSEPARRRACLRSRWTTPTWRASSRTSLDATTGRAFLDLSLHTAQDRIVCCGANNRGLAMLGDTLFMGTLDAQLIAIDAKTGRTIWKTEVATTKSG
ncbi:MAG: hypothetical protein Q7R41_14375 [Phycisphaerales bacterium]|nr:hypothetical protein [Phycisphaerales bacterium]